MSVSPQGPGWWIASDGRWYPPELHPSYRPPVPSQQLGASTSFQHSSSHLEREALDSVSSVERALFGWALKSAIRDRKSRFYRLLPHYGVTGSARLLVARLWRLPSFLFGVPAIALEVGSNGGSSARMASYVLLGIAFTCCLLIGVRGISAARWLARSRGGG